MTSSATPSPTTAVKENVNVTESIQPLIDRAGRTSATREIVIAPVQHHQRTLKRRLTEAKKPLNRFEFTDETSLGTDILHRKGRETRTLDRVDRFMQYQRLLQENDAAKKRFEMILGSDPVHRAKVIEQARVEIFATTNLHPDRIDAFRKTAENLPRTVAEDSIDILEGVLSVELALRRRTEHVPSPEELVRKAIRCIRKSGGEDFKAAFSRIQQVTIAGLSNVPAPMLDLVTALSRNTDLTLELVGRAVTSDYLQKRLQTAVVPTPGEGVILG